MGYFKWANSKIKKFKWHDISLTKLSVLFFALFLAKVWPAILGLDWYWYLILCIVVAIPVWMKLFKK
ncbi:MAG: hypothetical protein KAT43_03390 [Nanoarchaeota archaeon]|nr:hypothetical protein [Nanoarchaeota archaeon]